MQKPVTALLLLVAAIVTPARPAAAEPYFKAETILQMCGTQGRDAAAKQNLCAFYLTGISDAIVTSSLYARPAGDNRPLEPILCLPDPVSPDALSAALTGFAKAHPERRGDDAARLATDALKARYACPKPGSKPDVVFFSAGDIAQRCTDADALTGFYCLYYVVGVSDFYASRSGPPQMCYPASMADDQPRRSFAAYMAAHPAARDDNAALTAARALHAAFPCR